MTSTAWPYTCHIESLTAVIGESSKSNYRTEIQADCSVLLGYHFPLFVGVCVLSSLEKSMNPSKNITYQWAIYLLGLTNDYFSWNVEKDQPTDRMRNGVIVLMKQYNMPAEFARTLLLGVIIEEESKAAKLREKRLEQPVSEEILRYIEAIELYVGGSYYWHASAPRYQRFE